MSALSYLSWVDAATQIQEGKLSSKDYVESQLARIESLNPTLNAFLHIDAEGALERAAKADQMVSSGADVGPMHGVPFALKDIIDVAGMPCTAH